MQRLFVKISFIKNCFHKGVAYRCLARFIASIEKEKIEPKLIENYLKMADSEIRDLLPE